MDVPTYLRAVRKSWWLIVLTVVLGAGGGFYYSHRATPVYAAHVTFFVSATTNATTNAQSTNQFAQDEAVSLSKLVSSDIAAQAVIADSGLQLPVGVVAAKMSATAQINTTIVNTTVLDTSTQQALTIARSLSNTFADVAAGVQSRGVRLQLTTTSGPSVGLAPVSPRTTLNVAFGAAAGLVLGLLLAVLRLLRDTSVRTREDLESIAHAPVVGDIAYDRSARSAPLVLERQARSVRAEAFRQLRTNLQFVDAAGALRTMVITSTTESEGKSTTATNLALTFAEAGRSVVLVGADLRRPRVAQYLGLEHAIGLTNVLVGQVELDDALQPFGVDGLCVLASGSVPPNPSELLGSPLMIELLERLRDRFDLVVIDTPPLLPVTDAAVLAVHADGVVVVCRHGKTGRAQLRTAVRALESINARVVGTVLTMRPSRGPEAEGYGTYRYYDDANRGRRRLAWRRPGRRSARPAWAADDLRMIGSARVTGHLRPESAPVEPFEDRLGHPVDAAETPTDALAAFERRQSRPSRTNRRRTIAIDRAQESRPATAMAETAEDADAATALPLEMTPAEMTPAESVPAETARVPANAAPSPGRVDLTNRPNTKRTRKRSSGRRADGTSHRDASAHPGLDTDADADRPPTGGADQVDAALAGQSAATRY